MLRFNLRAGAWGTRLGYVEAEAADPRSTISPGDLARIKPGTAEAPAWLSLLMGAD